MKNLNLSIVIGLITLFFVFNSCSKLDENLYFGKEEDVITKDSELFNLLSKVTTDGDNPTENIVCLDFIYPFKVLIYDENLQIIGSQYLAGDDEFSAFLGQLPSNHSLSISFPITTTLSDGTVFSVNSNEELKIAIDSCSKEDIIGYCNGLFSNQNQTANVWEVLYKENYDNTYTSGFFEANDDGTLHFNYNNINYTGTWVFLFVDDILHININLEGNSIVAQYWNFDKEVILTGQQIKIMNSPKNIILSKVSQITTLYQIGNSGQAGGIVFYDKGSYSKGWRYMEVASTDLDFFEWGCSGSLINNCNSSSIGNGLFNSAQIANYHDNLTNYYSNPSVCNSLNNGTVVAQKALLFQQNNFSDWFLPSENELSLMYQNLYLNGVGNFTASNYWTSTQMDAENAKTINFNDGTTEIKSKIPTTNNVKARAVRYF